MESGRTHTHFGLFPFSLLFLIFFCAYPLASLAAEQITVFSPKGTQFAGAPIFFHIQTKNIVLPQSATLYYRAKGIKVFRRLSMKKETEVDFRVLLDARKVIPPGIEYFFVLKDKMGHIFTFPKFDPKKKPYSLKVELDKRPPHLVKTVPARRATISEARPAITISFEDKETKVDTKTVRISIDGTDITQLAEITETEAKYTPVAPLDYGKHTISVEMQDICGNRLRPQTWDFTIRRSARLQKASADIQWDGEFRHLAAHHEDNKDPSWRLQSSATLKSALESGPFKTSLDGNVWYTEEQGPGPEGDRFNLNNYLYKAGYGKQSFEFGDVTVQGTELISQSIARRGGVLKMEAGGTKAQAFALRSNAVTGFEHLIGINQSDQRLVGVSLSQDMLKDKVLVAKGTYITGKNHSPDNYNSSTLEAGTEGDIYSLGLSSEIIKEKLKVDGEYSVSKYDSDVSDNIGKTTDKAWLAKVSGKGTRYDWEAKYKYLGPEFQSIVNATGATNRVEYQAAFGLRVSSSNFRLTALRVVDNADEDPLMPVITNTTGTFTYNLSKPKWPSFFFNYSLNRQDSSDEPQNYSPIKNQTQTMGGGLSLSRNRWSIAPTYTFTTFDDKSAATNNDSRTHVATISGSFRPIDTVSINPSISYTNLHAEATDVTTKTYQGALGAVVSLHNRTVDVNGTLSYLDNKADDGSSHTTTFNGIAQLNWHLEKIFSTKGRQTLSLRAQYSRTEDHVTHKITRDGTIYCVLSFGIPIKLF